jgi:hypothetical protein
MRLVQFMLPGMGRRVGRVDGQIVADLTSGVPEWASVYHIFLSARAAEQTIEEHIAVRAAGLALTLLDYEALWMRKPGDADGWLLPPLDHPDPAHCFVGGTGLTHLGSTAARDAMHKAEATSTGAPQTDSQRMFDMGLKGGRPKRGERGISPECFYKGSGVILRGHRDWLDIPAYAQDGGEEPELVGCYVIGPDGQPYRLGFTAGNEWSDHAVERVNYLWLAPSKLRPCAMGPELVTDLAFDDVRGCCRIYRQEEVLYDSGELLTGEANMSHSLANLEDHHFKYPQFRVPGDVHLYYFGTMSLSFGKRGPMQDGDVIEIRFDALGKPLINTVRREPSENIAPIVVRKG